MIFCCHLWLLQSSSHCILAIRIHKGIWALLLRINPNFQENPTTGTHAGISTNHPWNVIGGGNWIWYVLRIQMYRFSYIYIYTCMYIYVHIICIYYMYILYVYIICIYYMYILYVYIYIYIKYIKIHIIHVCICVYIHIYIRHHKLKEQNVHQNNMWQHIKTNFNLGTTLKMINIYIRIYQNQTWSHGDHKTGWFHWDIRVDWDPLSDFLKCRWWRDLRTTTTS